MTEFEAKKVVLKDVSGDYIAPVSYGATYTNQNNLNIETELNNKLTQQQITNCIIETPQNLFWEEITNGVRLKAGSIVTFPDGFEQDSTTLKFRKLTITEDMDYTYTSTGTGNYFLLLNAGSDFTTLGTYGVASSIVGSTAPTGAATWYDTTTNLIKTTNSSGVVNGEGYPLPLGIFNRGTRKLVQSFDYCGWLGSSCFVLEGVKCLSPDGRNADGSLKNKVITTINSIDTGFATNVNAYIRIQPDGSVDATNIFRTTAVESFGNLPVISNNTLNIAYVKEDNQYYYYWVTSGITEWTPIDFGCVGFLITDADKKPTVEFSIRQPISIMDMENPMIPNIDGQWVQKNSTVFSNISTIDSYSYDISSYLPNDDNAYEVQALLLTNDQGATSTTNCTCCISGNTASPISNRAKNLCPIEVVTDSTSGNSSNSGSVIFPYDSRTLYMQISGRAPSNGINCIFYAYRRIGTNN